MFTIEQIKEAHDKVKSGADFPKYIQEIKAFGVIRFETWVKDSHTDYLGINDYRISSKPMYDSLNIASTSNKIMFEHYLKTHQMGETTYLTFCKQCAQTGIEKWIVHLKEMTCTYYDIAGKKILVERIPE